jgi:hypothetical protein
MMQKLRVTLIGGLTALTLLSVTGCENSPVSTPTQSKTPNTSATTNIAGNGATTHDSSATANATKHAKHSTIKNVFNYSKYLPFTPLLPSYTTGHQLIHANITRYLNTGENGDAISYSAAYANAFVMTEGRPSELHIVPLPGSKTNITLSNDVHATMERHDGGESIVFTQNGLLFDVTTLNAGVSLQELEKVCESISVPATQTPSEIHESDSGPQSANALSFNPVKAGQFYVPGGYSLNVQGSAININGSSKSESFQITYRKGSSYLTVKQSMGTQPDYTNNTAYHSTMIHGVSVSEQHVNSMEPVAVCTLPQTHVHVVVDSNISSGEINKVVNSFLNTAMSNANQ